MPWQHLFEVALQSPVLVALIPAVIALVAGRHLLQAKDERIAAIKDAHAAELRAKDAEIAALDRWTPARLQEHVDAMKEFFELRTEQLTSERDAARKALEQGRDADAREREHLNGRLQVTERKLVEARKAQRATEEASLKLAEVMIAERSGIFGGGGTHLAAFISSRYPELASRYGSLHTNHGLGHVNKDQVRGWRAYPAEIRNDSGKEHCTASVPAGLLAHVREDRYGRGTLTGCDDVPSHEGCHVGHWVTGPPGHADDELAWWDDEGNWTATG